MNQSCLVVTVVCVCGLWSGDLTTRDTSLPMASGPKGEYYLSLGKFEFTFPNVFWIVPLKNWIKIYWAI